MDEHLIEPAIHFEVAKLRSQLAASRLAERRYREALTEISRLSYCAGGAPMRDIASISHAALQPRKEGKDGTTKEE